jgi:DNA-binding transcriptional LysR family regulator
MTLAQLRALVAVVDSRSFSRAAELLRVTQSGVSHAVATLEKELAMPLFERGRGPLLSAATLY